LGSSLPPGVRTITVPVFVNTSTEPQIENEATRAVIREIQREGSLRVVESGEADAILKVTLTQCDIEPVRYERDRPKAAAEYRLKIGAQVMLVRRVTGDTILARRVEGQATFLAGGDLTASKLAALPQAAADLGRAIAGCLVDYW
ncbi:MAG: LPS assembly lipoprotein LptE, partial [Kiritimatiellae bacterium]|nr:LPS assembly lipoprotein LptE [Kiritimatiellia bacterium]